MRTEFLILGKINILFRYAQTFYRLAKRLSHSFMTSQDFISTNALTFLQNFVNLQPLLSIESCVMSHVLRVLRYESRVLSCMFFWGIVRLYAVEILRGGIFQQMYDLSEVV